MARCTCANYCTRCSNGPCDCTCEIILSTGGLTGTTKSPLADQLMTNNIVVTPAMAQAFIKAHAEAAAQRIPKIYAKGQREEQNVIVGLRAALAAR